MPRDASASACNRDRVGYYQIQRRYLGFVRTGQTFAHTVPNAHSVAFIAGKKQGNAVWRNAAKRRMREVCRANGGPWKGYDVIFLAKSDILKASYSKVLSACADAVEKGGLQ